VKSIRVFLIATLLATITLVNFVSALHGYRNSMKEEERLFNGLLIQKTALIKTFVLENQQMEDVESNPKVISGIFGQEEESTFAFQIWDNHAQLIARSSNAPTKALVALKNQTKEVNFKGYRWTTLTSFDRTNQAWIVAAERSDIHFKLAEKIILESVLPIVMVIPFLGGMVWLIVSFGLRPIANLAAEMEKKEAADLSPITLEKVPQELSLLAETANGLLGRLEASFAREKRFTGDAAHELRTPIAALKIHLGNLLAEIKTPPTSAQKLKLGVDRMGHLVEQILSLNRTATDHFMAKFSRLELSEIAKEVIGDQISAITQKKQSISFEGSGGSIYGDYFTIEVLIKNLLSNAVKYTPAGGKIVVKIKTRANKVLLQVIDNGPGIPEEKYERVFERFYRAVGQHEVSVIGCGLGLSIVQQIVDLHNAEISLSKPEAHSGLCVSLAFSIFDDQNDVPRVHHKPLSLET